jgi:hypothetical protein
MSFIKHESWNINAHRRAWWNYCHAKVSSLTKQAKEAGFKIGEIEIKRSRHNNKEHEDKKEAE